MSTMTPGQLSASQYQEFINGTNWQDWVPAAGSIAGFSNAALSDSTVSAMMAAPEGTYTPEQIRNAAAKVDQLVATGGAQALGQANLTSKQNEATEGVQWWKDNPNGHQHNSLLDRFMTNIFPPLVATAFAVVGGQALGAAFSGGGATAAGGAGAAGAGGAAAAEAAAAGAAGLGSGAAAGGTALGTTIGASGIPQVIISGTAGGAGVGLGTATAIGAAGLGGLAAIGSGGAGAPPFDPNAPIQSVEVPRPPAPPTNIPEIPYMDLGLGIGAGSALPINGDALQQLPNVEPTPEIPQVIVPGRPPVTPGPGAFPNLPIPVLPLPTGVQPGPGSGNTPTTGLPSLSDILNGLTPILAGLNDKDKAEKDSAWWKSQLDELSGMYKPGTLEATQMEQKMEARDAAAGRRSQYGVRAVNLASNLAEKRAGIMTSAGYQNMANAYRNRDSQSLNSLFAAAGGSGTQNLVSGLINGLGGLFKG